MENLDAADPPARFAGLASLIVNGLQSPDILALEEVQDDNGPTNDALVDATRTYALLIQAIKDAGGPAYEVRQVNPRDDQDGGQPGGNVRVALLFRFDHGLCFVDRPGAGPESATIPVLGPEGLQLTFSPGRIRPTDAAWSNDRKPLAGEFRHNGQTLFVIANHFNSKGGDDPLFGRFQPPVLDTEAQRREQAEVERDFISAILALDPQARVVALGDLNDFEFSPPLGILKGTDMTALVETLPPGERYTYVFDGNSQALDHTLVSPALLAHVVAYDILHLNAEYVERGERPRPPGDPLPPLRNAQHPRRRLLRARGYALAHPRGGHRDDHADGDRALPGYPWTGGRDSAEMVSDAGQSLLVGRLSPDRELARQAAFALFVRAYAEAAGLLPRGSGRSRRWSASRQLIGEVADVNPHVVAAFVARARGGTRWPASTRRRCRS